MAASIEDVAKLAGVSIATVSRSLRGLPDVAAATRDKVLAAARELDYVASPFAARLASGRSSTLGVVVPFVHRWFFAEVLGAVEAVLREAGYDCRLKVDHLPTYSAAMPFHGMAAAYTVGYLKALLRAMER